MGQAKSRGNQEQRIAEARARERAKFPDSVKCNSCEAALTDIEPLDVRGVPGLRLAGSAYCTGCSSATWVLDGTEEALAVVAQQLQQQHGGEPLLAGFEQKVQG